VSALNPKTRADLSVESLDGESVVYDQTSGTVHHLNGTATLVFTLLDGTASVAELSTDIAEVVGQPLEQIRFQVHRLVEDFRTAGLLEGEILPTGS